jgi:hypothetical protein
MYLRAAAGILRCTTSGVAGNGLGTTIMYLRAAADIGLGNATKYLRGAAGIGLGTMIKYLRRSHAQRAAPRAAACAPRSSTCAAPRTSD